MKQYADAGLDMMYEHAQFEDGSTSVEAGVLQMLDRMRGGRWKVFKGDNDAWLDEVRTYHRDAKTGLIVKEADDAISASRYGMMMLRNARTDAAKADFNRPLVYPEYGTFLMSEDFQTIFVQMRRPTGGDPGVTEAGYFQRREQRRSCTRRYQRQSASQ